MFESPDDSGIVGEQNLEYMLVIFVGQSIQISFAFEECDQLADFLFVLVFIDEIKTVFRITKCKLTCL